MASSEPATGRLVPLEALRGIAALVLVVYHYLLGFDVTRVGILAGTLGERSWVDTPLFALINGHAAVVCFFVLSGYVLAMPGLERGSRLEVARAAAKRWLRLAGPVLVSTLLSWLLFATGLYYYQQAARLTGSRWLDTFGFANRAEDGGASLLEALAQGTYASFLDGRIDLNTVLWTMRYEFIGSFVAFGLAAVLMGVTRRRSALALLGVALVTAHFQMPYMACFVVGVGLHYLDLGRVRLAWPPVAAVLVASAYLFGYFNPRGWYLPLVLLDGLGASLRIYVHTIAAIGLIIVFASRNAVSERFSGPLSSWLGRISFPLYLVHVLVFASASSWLYVRLADAGVPALGLVVFVASLAVLAPLTAAVTLFEQWWLKVVRRVGEWLVPGEPSPGDLVNRAAVEPRVTMQTRPVRPAAAVDDLAEPDWAVDPGHRPPQPLLRPRPLPMAPRPRGPRER